MWTARYKYVRKYCSGLPYVVVWYVENQLANARNSNSRTKFYWRYKSRLRPDTHVTNLTYLPVKLVEEYLEPSKALLRQISTLRPTNETSNTYRVPVSCCTNERTNEPTNERYCPFVNLPRGAGECQLAHHFCTGTGLLVVLVTRLASASSLVSVS